ncbi:hypothetical protein FGO68_gene4992 [Halteria grandinella]|uniref:Uncharacterized protein n=1 Tax=Halteria grandinella TaxID=5974 RepID=A0A8J8P0Q2_HALGN|nr:hypothetical protein FGO68_gene4992 [Halteria grandinella]
MHLKPGMKFWRQSLKSKVRYQFEFCLQLFLWTLEIPNALIFAFHFNIILTFVVGTVFSCRCLSIITYVILSPLPSYYLCRNAAQSRQSRRLFSAQNYFLSSHWLSLFAALAFDKTSYSSSDSTSSSSALGSKRAPQAEESVLKWRIID